MSTRWSTKSIVDGLVQNPSCPLFFDLPKTLNSLEFSQNNEYHVVCTQTPECATKCVRNRLCARPPERTTTYVLERLCARRRLQSTTCKPWRVFKLR